MSWCCCRMMTCGLRSQSCSGSRELHEQWLDMLYLAFSWSGAVSCQQSPLAHACIAACRTQTGINLDDSEIRAAVKLLDKRGSGYIEFDEFVSWWTSKVVPEHKVGAHTLRTTCHCTGCNSDKISAAGDQSVVPRPFQFKGLKNFKDFIQLCLIFTARPLASPASAQ